MKNKMLLLAALLLLSVPAQAQWCIGGFVSFSHSWRNKTSDFSFKPDVSYGFGNVSVGASLILERYSFYDEGRYDMYFGLAPYVQYYYWSTGPLSLLVEGGVQFTRNIAPDSVYNRWEPYLTPGLEFSLSDHWSLVGYLGRLEYDSYSKTFRIGLDAASFTFGVYYGF